MAAVAAGSLILFSFLAERAAITTPRGSSIVPKEPIESARGPIVVPAPGPPPAETGPGGLPEVIVVGPETSAEPDEPPPISPPAISAAVSVEIAFRPPVRVPGPRVGIRPNRPRPPYYGEPTWDDCPDRPIRPRSPGEHPHGGPPACGNPHGQPPGYAAAKNRSPTPSGNSRGRRDEKPEWRHHAGGSDEPKKGGTDAPSPGPSEHRSTNGKPPGGSGGGPPPSHGSGSPHGSGSGSDHPQGGPPGQTKSESGSGHPHGGPPGQSKAKKKS